MMELVASNPALGFPIEAWQNLGRPERLPDFEIEGYLQRWALLERDPLANLYLHHMIGPDEQILHNHPWPFRSYILSGGYVSLHCDGERKRPVERRSFKTGDVYSMGIAGYGDEEFHYIERVEPGTWTLVVVGPTVRDWGFLVHPDGRLPEVGTRLAADFEYVPEDALLTGRNDRLIFRNGYDGRSMHAVAG